MLRKIIIICGFCLLSLPMMGQFMDGTTGLLHAPTADMQHDKTVMIGGSYLNSHATPSRWKYDTWNYYLNVTIFPWLEVSYACVIFNEWIQRGGGRLHMINQDRHFSGRLRIWKEGWWKEWTPQIVAGVNDPTTGSSGDYMDMGVSGNGNGYFNRYYFAVSKHFSWLGRWGVHLSYSYNRREKMDKLNGMTYGVDYSFGLPETSFVNKVVNKLNLLAEYDSKHVNIGAKYAYWKDYIHAMVELYDCQYPSVGLYIKLHLK